MKNSNEYIIQNSQELFNQWLTIKQQIDHYDTEFGEMFSPPTNKSKEQLEQRKRELEEKMDWTPEQDKEARKQALQRAYEVLQDAEFAGVIQHQEKKYPPVFSYEVEPTTEEYVLEPTGRRISIKEDDELLLFKSGKYHSVFVLV